MTAARAQGDRQRRRAKKRFDEWLSAEDQVGRGRERASTTRVLAIKDAANSIAAAARIGQITQNFSRRAVHRRDPGGRPQPDVEATTGEDKVDAYCDALTEAAEPLAEKSLDGVRRVPRRSRPSSAGSASGRSCASASSARSSRKSSRRRRSSAATRTRSRRSSRSNPPSKLD